MTCCESPDSTLSVTPTQPRVLFVNHVAVLSGAEYCLLDIATDFRDTSRLLLFADGPLREKAAAAGVDVQVLPAPAALMSVKTSSVLTSLAAVPALLKMALQVKQAARGFDVMYADSQKAFMAAAIATLMGAPPLIWHLRDIMTARHFSAVNRRIAVALANLKVAKILVVSQATKAAFMAAGGRPERVSVVHDGISSEPFDQVTEAAAQQMRQSLGLADVPVVGLFSRLSHWKGQHILIEAMHHLPGVHALIVGDALFGEDDYVAQIKALARQPEVADRIHWLGFRSDVPVLMKACDIVVHTSTEPEPCARAAIEGQLAGRPVIVAAAGGMFEVVPDETTGRTAQPGNAAQLAQTIRELLDHPDLAAQLGHRGQAHARAEFSPVASLQAIRQVIDDVVGRYATG